MPRFELVNEDEDVKALEFDAATDTEAERFAAGWASSGWSLRRPDADNGEYTAADTAAPVDAPEPVPAPARAPRGTAAVSTETKEN